MIKKQALIHIFRHGSIFRTESHMFSETGYMYTVHMIIITDMYSVWEIMYAGQRR